MVKTGTFCARLRDEKAAQAIRQRASFRIVVNVRFSQMAVNCNRKKKGVAVQFEMVLGRSWVEHAFRRAVKIL